MFLFCFTSTSWFLVDLVVCLVLVVDALRDPWHEVAGSTKGRPLGWVSFKRRKH